MSISMKSKPRCRSGRVALAVCLLGLGLAAPAAVQDVGTLINTLQNLGLSEAARASAARDIGIFGTDSNAAPQALIGALGNDPSAQVRSAAATALGAVRLQSASALQALISAMQSDGDAMVRAAAAAGLSMLGQDSNSAEQAVISVMQKDSSPMVRAAAAGALGLVNIDMPSATAALISVLGNDRGPEVRVAAAQGLGKIGEPAGGAVQALQNAQSQDSDPGVRAAAAKAIQMITNTQWGIQAMRMRTRSRIMMVFVMVSLLPASPSMAQGPSCYVTPGMEKTFVSVRELDQDSNPLGEIGSGWLKLGEQVPVNSRTGNIVINYQLASSDKGIQTDPQDCSNGRVITVP